MQMTRKVTINISRDELAEIIKDYLSEEGFEVDAKNVNFNLETAYEGYGYDEHEVKKFTGCNVVCELKTKRADK